MGIQIVMVLLGGGLGAVTRYGTTLYAARLFGTAFPWGTLIVNLAGCFLIGFLYALAEVSNLIGVTARIFWMTGFLGGLTTFSAFGLETLQAGRSGEGMLLIGNLLLNNAGGLLMVALGMLAVRVVVK